MAITLITPHQRPNSGGVYAIEQFARYAAAVTEVHIVVAKGEPVPIRRVHMHGPAALEQLALPQADALLIPADMRNAERLFGLTPDRGMPILLFQGYGAQDDPVVHANLVLAAHAICTSSWLVDESLAAGCTATLLRYGLDRRIVFPGPPTEDRGPVVAMMTHPLDWKGTADGLKALRLVLREVPELEVRLFGKLKPRFKAATFLPAPNQLSDVAALMRESAVFVCSSWEEGFGLPGIEAITSGAALATTDTKGSRDYAFHERTALVSEPRDPAALARNIVQLIRDPGMRARLVQAGREHVDAIYPDWEDTADAFLTAVDEGARAVRTARMVGSGVEPDDPGGDGRELRSAPSAWREARRAKLLLLEAAAEREELEAQLVRRIKEATRTEVRAGELQAQLEHERTAHEQAETKLAASEARHAAVAVRLAAAEEELARMGSELELTGAQRRRLQSALARARADAQVAEAERAGLERTTAELSALVDQYTDEREAQRNGRRAQAASAISAVQLLPSAARTWPALPASELEAQQTFRAQYGDLLTLVAPREDGRDPLALPMPNDPRGMLAATDEDQGVGVRSVDVVVCVHNALEHVRLCLWSLLQKTGRRFRLIVVNDGSDEDTTAFLAELAARVTAVTLIHRADPPHGYTVAANLGLRASSSDYVVMLNSDTIVSYEWLERIVEFAERNDRVGILGPLSNAATHQSIPERRSAGQWATNPLPSWLTPDAIALILEQAPRTNMRLPFINGFCFVIKRAVISAIGEFDEKSFAAGYAEESDYAQRARAAGFELAVVDDAYVYHAKSQSYGGVEGKKVSRRAYQTFLDKHGAEEINRLVREIEADASLEPVRAMLAEAISSPSATESLLAQHVDPLSVAFVLPGLGDGGSGGSHSIYQEVHGLRRLGVKARIALHERAWDRAQAAYDDATDVFETFTDADDLARLTADANVIIATHFKSVATVAAVRAQRDDFLPAYYVQDYEPLFMFADAADNEEASASYTAIPGTLVFAKTHWLCNVVSRRHGVFVAKVEPSIDEGLYRPGDVSVRPGPVRIAAMVRPRTPRRQPYSTVGVLEQLLEKLPGAVEVRTFGCHDPELRKITQSPALHASHRGLLKREQVAELLRGSDVFLDMSSYQAFGRTALEAMACGATAVVPRLGGVWEFAQDGRNLLAIDTLDRDAAFEAVASLVDDRERLAELKRAARETASRYSILRAALSEYVVLRHAYQAQMS